MKYWLRRIWWGAWFPIFSKQERLALCKILYKSYLELVRKGQWENIGLCFAVAESYSDRRFRNIIRLSNLPLNVDSGTILKNIPELIQYKPIMKRHRWGRQGAYWYNPTAHFNRLGILNAAILEITYLI